MLNVKVIDNIKTKLFPLGNFFVRTIPDYLTKKKKLSIFVYNLAEFDFIQRKVIDNICPI